VRSTRAERERDRELQQQAEHAYRRLVADWRATAPKAGAGAAPGRGAAGALEGGASERR
jgi:hypothetical protein